MNKRVDQIASQLSEADDHLTALPRFVFDFPFRGKWHEAPVCFGVPDEILSSDALDDVKPILEKVSRRAREGAWAAGFVAYEAAPAFDAAFQVHRPMPGVPRIWFGIFSQPLPHVPRQAGNAGMDPVWTLTTSEKRFRQDIDAIRAAIRNGDFYQVNHTIRSAATVCGDKLAWFARLAQAQRNSYAAYLDIGSHSVISLSPELFFARDGDVITTRPMKGTWPRGRWLAEDNRRADELFRSEKNRAENLMIVDLLRNDLARISSPWGVTTPALFETERYASLWQMTSTIQAKIAPALGLDQIFAALFPCGSITGAPKVKAMEWIAHQETGPRGVYCGSIGIVRPGGDAIFNVAIRTVLVEEKTENAVCGLGSGITSDSDPAEEYAEVLLKSKFLASEFENFSLFETARVQDGQVLRLDLHLHRLQASACYFQIAFDPDKLKADLLRYLSETATPNTRLKIVLDQKGQWRFETHALPAAVECPATIKLATAPISSRNIWLFHKTTKRQDYEAALDSGGRSVFDVLLWNENREITEFTRGNVVMEIDGRRVTPPVSCGLLGGCLRRQLLDANELIEQSVTLSELPRVTRMWFINSLRGTIEIRWPDQAVLESLAPAGDCTKQPPTRPS